MGYTIGQVAEKMGLTAHTLRYYDKEGLLPFVKKSASGLRVFSDSDIEWLVIIECLKSTGLQIKDIKQYIDWYREGDSTLGKRLELLKQQQKKVEEQMELLKKHKEKLDFKIAFYNDAIANGTAAGVLERNKLLAEEKKRIFAS